MRCESYSSVTTFQKCPYRYKLRYVDKIEKKQDSEALRKGREVHEKIEKDDSTGEHLEEVKYARTHKAKGKARRVKLKRKQLVYVDLKKDGDDVLIEESEIGFSICPKKEAPRGVSIEEFENPKGIFRGFIDYQILYFRESPENFENFNDLAYKIKIFDWKTGKVKPNRWQLNLYAFAMELLYPKAQIECSLVYTSAKKESSWLFTFEEEKKAVKKLTKTLRKISSTRDTGEWTKTGVLCNWCEYQGQECDFAAANNRLAEKIKEEKSDLESLFSSL